MKISLETIMTREGYRYEYADGKAAGGTEIVANRGVVARPVRGATMAFVDLDAAEYYILAMAIEALAVKAKETGEIEELYRELTS